MASAPVPRRVRWAVRELDVQPDDQLLEIGCGAGVAVWLICQRLERGRVTAIDRSVTAVRRAAQRNAAHIAAGQAIVRQVDLADLGLPDREPRDLALADRQFDKIFAINVNLFWVRPAGAEVTAVKRLLRPRGIVHLFYEAPGPDRAARVADMVATALATAGFATQAVAEAGSTLARVIATRGRRSRVS